MQTATAVSPMTSVSGVKAAMSAMTALPLSPNDKMTMIGVMTDCQRSLMMMAETVGLNDNVVRKICNDCACMCECCNKMVCRESIHCNAMLSVAMACCQVCVETIKGLNDEMSKMCMTHLNNFINCCSNLGISPSPLKPQSILGHFGGLRMMEGMGMMPQMGGMGMMPQMGGMGMGMMPQMGGMGMMPQMGGMGMMPQMGGMMSPMGGMMSPMGGMMHPQMSGMQWPMMGGMMNPQMMNPHMMGPQMMNWPMMDKSMMMYPQMMGPGMMGPGMMGPGMMGGMPSQMSNMMHLMHGLVECMRECLKCCESSNDVNVRKCCLDCDDVCECLFKLVCRDSSYCVPILNMLVTCCRSCVECCCTHDTESCRCCMMTCQNLMNCCNTVLSSCISSPVTMGERIILSSTEKNNMLNLLAECSRCCRVACEMIGAQSSLKKLLCDCADACDLCFKMCARDSPCFHSFLCQCLSCCRTTMDHLRGMDAPACRTCWNALNNLCTAAASITRTETSK